MPLIRFCVAVAALGLATAPAAAAPPESQMAPSVAGRHHAGHALVLAHGEWRGEPTRLRFQWQAWADGRWQDIPGATAQRFVPQSPMRVSGVVIAANADGERQARSNAIDVTPESAGLAWTGSRGIALDANASESQAPRNNGHAWTDALPLDVYFEIQVDETQPSNRVGVWPFSGAAPEDPGEWGTLGQSVLATGFGISGDGEWANHAFFADRWVDTAEVDTRMEPARRWGFHLNAARELRVRQVWPGGASPWYNDGRPVAVFPGRTPLHIGHTASAGLGALLIPPADHYAAPPPGARAL